MYTRRRINRANQRVNRSSSAKVENWSDQEEDEEDSKEKEEKEEEEEEEEQRIEGQCWTYPRFLAPA